MRAQSRPGRLFLMALECYACAQSALSDLPVREQVWVVPGWRVAHDFNSSLPGWLILVPTRHVESLDELTAEEADTLGLLLRQASIALKTVTGCRKTYVMMFAEKVGFTHVHFHVVPRMDDFPEDRVGPGVFGYLRETPLVEDRRDQLGAEIRSAWPSD
jgi:diadenosine tetraphosphate (Ap4A) HIT family hydrolase